jgi:transcriptional antiterminator NusG
MDKKWYVVHTLSGFEHRAKTALEERIKLLGKGDLFGKILVPTEKVVELVKGKKKTSSRKFFPGYILVEMVLNDETWHIVKGTPKITGFVGGSTNPPSLTDQEVKEITQQMEDGALKPKPRVLFSVGESVKVIDGPFVDFNGVVEEVRPDRGKLRVLISIFGRATPVELEFVQVERN